MAEKKRGLGRGLSALLPGGPPAAIGPDANVPAHARTPASPPPSGHGSVSPITSATIAAATPARRTYFAAGIEELYPSPEQPRRKFDDAKLAELADSIKVHGIIVPLVVRPRPGS